LGNLSVPLFRGDILLVLLLRPDPADEPARPEVNGTGSSPLHHVVVP
jgi:hypothetical protein